MTEKWNEVKRKKEKITRGKHNIYGIKVTLSGHRDILKDYEFKNKKQTDSFIRYLNKENPDFNAKRVILRKQRIYPK